ncbi:MAG: polymer-forming cytoskeletal protein [Candidatus Manganitrophaceae bacterium]
MLRREEKEKDKGTQSDEIVAFLRKETEFKGIITYNGTIQVFGKIEGEIITEGKLIVGETATINAEINAGTVICGGRITGNIRATERVQFLSGAVMSGSVCTPNLTVEEGVVFNGKCEMLKDEPPSAEIRPLQVVGHGSNGN